MLKFHAFFNSMGIQDIEVIKSALKPVLSPTNLQKETDLNSCDIE